MDRPTPIPGAKEGLLKLKEMGYTLIVITARSEVQREGTEKWLETHMPDSELRIGARIVERFSCEAPDLRVDHH